MDILFLGFVLVGIGILSVITLLQQQNKREKLRQRREQRERAELERKSAPCPECAEMILVAANRCKYCQADVAEHMVPFRGKVMEQEDEQRASWALDEMASGRKQEVSSWIFAAIFLIFAVVTVFFSGDLTPVLMMGMLSALTGSMALAGRKRQRIAAVTLAVLNSTENPE